jgi:hypothetical protein
MLPVFINNNQTQVPENTTSLVYVKRFPWNTKTCWCAALYGTFASRGPTSVQMKMGAQHLGVVLFMAISLDRSQSMLS